ncbi:hypothetical protein Taro_015148 [Colocasia esculenta]|uniref:Secreted protein n=1 Tax=Colocasia esculenta TaxID=4460 RepID=A0A843ULJ5_COLES|nr:hypothetical protein [Colocasia esculenta]
MSNRRHIFTILHVSVLCQAPRVHTPAVNKYVGALLPRTGYGPIAQALDQVLDRSPTLCRTNIFILWPQSFNDKLICRHSPYWCRHHASNTRQNNANWSSSVDTSPGSGSVDTRDSSQNTFWPSWDSVSTLAQVVSTLEAFPEHHLGCFGTAGRH